MIFAVRIAIITIAPYRTSFFLVLICGATDACVVWYGKLIGWGEETATQDPKIKQTKPAWYCRSCRATNSEEGLDLQGNV